MEILPSEYQNIELSRYEKMFVRHAISNDGYGFLLLKVNPTMIENESMNVLISSRGVVFFKFFEDFSDASLFGATMQPYTQFVYPTAKKIISEKLLGNKSLSENAKALKFPINIVHVFPNLKRADISKMSVSAILDFVQKQCLFSEDFSELRQGFGAIIDRVLDNPIVPVSDTPMLISDLNVNSVMQRIAPEYVTVRVACVDTADSTPGVDSELLVVDEKDVVVRAFRLDKEQINIVNRISKDDPNQLILACAGSGKSVLLISKCFKAAQMNPNKKFLITFRNENLHSLYTSITPSTGTLNGSIKLLARALRVPECRNKMDQMMALRSRLDGTNWVIVIDEAQHLKYAALEEIRSLTDDNPMTGEHGVGVVLIGNSEVYSRLQGRQQAQFAQLFSRIRMQREYTTRKVKEDDVRKLFPVLAEQDARKEMDFLLSVCRSPWGIRGAMNLYTNAASANDVSYENLYRMAAHMGIGMLGAV